MLLCIICNYHLLLRACIHCTVTSLHFVSAPLPRITPRSPSSLHYTLAPPPPPLPHHNHTCRYRRMSLRSWSSGTARDRASSWSMVKALSFISTRAAYRPLSSAPWHASSSLLCHESMSVGACATPHDRSAMPTHSADSVCN